MNMTINEFTDITIEKITEDCSRKDLTNVEKIFRIEHWIKMNQRKVNDVRKSAISK